MIMGHNVLVQMDSQGRIVLPRSVRSKEKKYFTCQTEADGTVHLTPVIGVITAKQAYFWTRRWKQGEKEASEAIRDRKYKVVEPDALDRYLESL